MEYAVQMGPMLLIGGLIVGLLAEATWRPGGYSLLADLVTGSGGSLFLGTLVWAVPTARAGMTITLLIGCVGAALAITGQRTLWRARPTPPFGPVRP